MDSDIKQHARAFYRQICNRPPDWAILRERPCCRFVCYGSSIPEALRTIAWNFVIKQQKDDVVILIHQWNRFYSYKLSDTTPISTDDAYRHIELINYLKENGKWPLE